MQERNVDCDCVNFKIIKVLAWESYPEKIIIKSSEIRWNITVFFEIIN